MRFSPGYAVAIGLSWAAPAWADPPDWCARWGHVAAVAAESRRAGIPEAALRAEADRIGSSPETRAAFRAIIEAAYARQWSPERARAQIEAGCRRP